jgi:putative membrane protein
MDITLTYLHHLAIFTLFGVLLIEAVLLRLPPHESWVRRIALVDLGYGIAAGVVLAAGLSRVAWGHKGSAFFTQNPLFWTKLGLFALIAAVSIVPTVRYLRWRKAVIRGDALPAAREVATARHWVHAQLGMFAALPLLAALMARGVGYF